MAKAKTRKKPFAYTKARDSEIQYYMGTTGAKLESTVMVLGKANQRIDELERHREMQLKENDASCTALDRLGYRIDEQDLVITKLLTDKQPAEPELPEGWSIKSAHAGGFVLYFGHVGKLTTYCGRDSAVVYAWLEHLGKNRIESFRFHSRRLAVADKVWWFTNEYGISSPDFKSLEACIRACIP